MYQLLLLGEGTTEENRVEEQVQQEGQGGIKGRESRGDSDRIDCECYSCNNCWIQTRDNSWENNRVTVGVRVGVAEGFIVGVWLGFSVGWHVGAVVGITVESALGETVGSAVGVSVGVAVGWLQSELMLDLHSGNSWVCCRS